MTTDTRPTNARVLEVLDKLAVAHPGRYEVAANTEHKKAAGVLYSYEDCIVGVVVCELRPDVHAQLLAWEAEHKNGFTLSLYNGAAAPMIDLLHEVFTADQFEVLAAAQRDQDQGRPWASIADDPAVREALA